MRPLPAAFAEYRWAPSSEEIAREFGLPVADVRRFDGNVPPTPTPASRPEAIAEAFARVNEYAHGGFPALVEAIAQYAGVEPENVVLGAGADDLILLCARSFAGPGDVVEIDPQPTYPLFRIAAQLAGAEVGGASPVVTFTCRPNNPTGEQGSLPSARPLVVDEAYFEFAGETAVASAGRGGRRAAHVLEGVRARRRTGRVRARGGGRRRRAEPSPGADADLRDLGRARARRARARPRGRLRMSPRGIAALRCSPSWGSSRHPRARTSCSSRFATRKPWALRSFARGSSCGSSRTGSASPFEIERTTTASSTRSPSPRPMRSRLRHGLRTDLHSVDRH